MHSSMRSRMATLPFVAAAILMASSVMAQVPTINNTQANYAGTAAGDWSNPGNVVGTADNACANMGAVGKVNSTAGYGFTIPGDATIVGANAWIKASSPGGQNVGVQLASNAVVEPPTLLGSQQNLAVFDSASGNCAVTSETSVGMGNPGLTPAIVNAASFGLIFTKLEQSTVKVDSICLEIDYTTTAGQATVESCFDEPLLTGIRVVKQVVGTPPAEDWEFSIDGGNLNNVDFTLPAGGGFEEFTDEFEVDTYTSTETPQEGYAVSSECYIGDSLVATGDESIEVEVDDAFAVCTFTNVLEVEETRATFLVTKDYSDDNDDEVQVTLTCNNGLPLEQSFMISEGNPVLFVITQFTNGFPDCTVTETDVADGYTPSYDNGSETSDESCAYSGVTEGDYTCDITNNADPAEFTVYKEWVIEGAGGHEVLEQVSVTIVCNNPIEGGYDTGSDYRLSEYLYGDDSLTVSVETTERSAECQAWEDVLSQSGVESSDDCGPRTILAGGSSSCTFTNTVFFEGIPTLSQYGMALMALLMLGVGFVGLRRFV